MLHLVFERAAVYKQFVGLWLGGLKSEVQQTWVNELKLGVVESGQASF